MSLAFSAQAEEVAYSHQLLRSILPPGQNVDTSFFEKGLDLSPGAYELDIVVNGVSYPKRKVVLREFEGRLEPAFTLKDLYTLPFKEEALAKLADVNPDTPIHPLSRYFESVACKVDAASQTLEISIPQLFLAERNIFDIAPQALWDYGEPGAVLNYNLSGSHFEDRQNGRMSSLYGTLNAQVNMGPWRLHSSGSFHVNRDVLAGETFSDHQWDLWNTYL